MKTCKIEQFVAFLSEPIADGLAEHMPDTDFTDAIASIKANIYERIEATTQCEPLILTALSERISHDEQHALSRTSVPLAYIEPLRYDISTVAPPAHIAARRR